MNKALIFFVLILVWSSCAKNNVTDVSTTECSTVTGATFTTNKGEMFYIIASKCSGISCHSAGGAESGKFLATSIYTSMKPFLTAATKAVLKGTMPETGSLTTAELKQWQCWSNNGFPE